MQALILGATGFVGHALGTRLVEAGHEVRALVRPGSARQALPAGVEARAGELGDPTAIARAAAGCELIFHCAGENALHAPPDALSWIHVAGTENVINAARHASARRLVLLSCADATLCNRDRRSWKEDSVLGQAPLGAWARTKLLAEELALQASDAKLSVTALRPGFVWGPGDRSLLPALCREARSGGVKLYGRGDNLLATLYVDNLVDALLAASEASDEVDGQAYHVNDGEYQSAGEFFGMLCEALGLPPPKRGIYKLSYAAAWLRRARGQQGAWPEEVTRRGRNCLLDCVRAAGALDYQPRVSVADGKQALTRWIQEVGGATGIEKLARKPASEADTRHFEELAEKLS